MSHLRRLFFGTVYVLIALMLILLMAFVIDHMRGWSAGIVVILLLGYFIGTMLDE